MYSTDKIVLKQILSADSDKLFEWINDPDLVHFNAGFNPVDDISHSEWFDAIRKNNLVRIFSIRKAGTNELIGTCQLHSINLVHRVAELQIRIGETKELDKGLGTDAVNLLLKFGFNELGLNRVFLHVFDTNERAIKVYKKAGMKEEGVLREAVFINGSLRNLLILAILRSEVNTK